MTSDLLTKESPVPVSAGEDDMRQFLSEIRKFPRLSQEEERELARKCAEGDADAIRHMVNSNLRLVVSIARDYAGRGVSVMDLVQEGSIGLLVAAKKFDYTLEYRFSTYATKWIRQGVSRALANHGLIRVPVHTSEKMRKVMAARQTLLQKNGIEPTLEQLADICDITADKVEKLIQLTPQTCSLDAPAGDDDGTLGVLLENVLAEQPYETLVREELSHILRELMAALDERQQKLLRLRFGLEDGKCYSLEQIGKLLGVSKERARQIEKQAIDKLNKAGTDVGLEDFLE